MDTVNKIRPFINPDDVLDDCKGKYDAVVVIGYNKQGHMAPRASENITQKDIMWMLEVLKQQMLRELDYGD